MAPPPLPLLRVHPSPAVSELGGGGGGKEDMCIWCADGWWGDPSVVPCYCAVAPPPPPPPLCFWRGSNTVTMNPIDQAHFRRQKLFLDQVQKDARLCKNELNKVVLYVAIERMRALMAPKVEEIGLELHNALEKELTDWISAQASQPSKGEINERAFHVWAGRLPCRNWGFVNGNNGKGKFVDAKGIQEMTDSVHNHQAKRNALVLKMTAEEIAFEVEISTIEDEICQLRVSNPTHPNLGTLQAKSKDLKGKCVSLTSDERKEYVKLESQKPSKIGGPRKPGLLQQKKDELAAAIEGSKLEFLRRKLPFRDDWEYRPKSHWDTLCLLVSSISVIHFQPNIDSQDSANMLCFLEHILPPGHTMLAQTLINGIRTIRNDISHGTLITIAMIPTAMATIK